jgi:cytochrome c oxidase subunit 2
VSGPAVQSSLRPAAAAAEATAEISWVLIAGAAIVFLIVMLCLALALQHRHRSSQADPDNSDNTRQPTAAIRWWIIGGGTVFPVLVLVPLLIYASARFKEPAPGAEPAAAGSELLVTVEARLWWWRITYRDPLLGLEVVSANQINLPVGRPVRLALISNDVIHSFWVAPLAGKVDMVPGKVHHLRLQVRQPGLYRGQCAEFCGEQHARMAIHVLAQPPTEFEAWLRAQALPAQEPRNALAQRGLALFNERRCSACHSVLGLGPSSAIGPDLTHLAGRLHLAAGTLPFSHESLAAWIADPQQAKPGARMPSYPMDETSMQALVAFLEQLR